MKVASLKLSLHGQTVGHVVGYEDGLENVLSLDPAFLENPDRPSLTLSFAPQADFECASSAFPSSTRLQLHPLLGNLLPEGPMRASLAQRLKTHEMNEFILMTHLGADLPGALIVEPVSAQEPPAYVFGGRGGADELDLDPSSAHVSLAGVQTKFSMHNKDDRYALGNTNAPGDWIIKTPSTIHQHVPVNEFTCMLLAKAIGVDVPDVRLVELHKLDGLPNIKIPNEPFAYAIRRFDRLEKGRIHTEDFSQVTFTEATQKYEKHSYEDIGRLLYRYGYAGQKDAIQMSLRLLANILLANGDAHKKNWSLIYPDGVNAHLSPAYDIVSTKVYMPDEIEFALSLGRTKHWYEVTLGHFKHWAQTADIPHSVIKYNLSIAMCKARELWPKMLAESPMYESHKDVLRQHWRSLQSDFKIQS